MSKRPPAVLRIDPSLYEKHDFLVYCNDVLVSLLQYADEQNLSTIQITFRNETDAHQYQKHLNESENGWQSWLIENGYKDMMYEAYYRHTFFSLVGDMCHFIYESIHCAAKMKVAVAYALLRKPLKDNLGYLEWLSVDRSSMLDILLNGPAGKLLMNITLAKNNTTILESKGYNCYFKYRYDRDDESSLEKIWNQANHLITTQPYTRTEDGTLNFIYPTEENLYDLIDRYYIIVPLILSYAIDLVCDMFKEFVSLNEYTVIMNKRTRIGRMMKMTDSIPFDKIRSLFQIDNLPTICPHCRHIIKSTDRMINRLLDGELKCSKCRKTTDTHTYIFAWEKLSKDHILSR